MSGGGRGRATAAVVLAVVGGLLTAGGTAAPWVRVEEGRAIGGVPVPDVETVGGIALAPALLPVGLAAALVGLTLVVTRGRLQVAAAALVGLAGLAAGGITAAALLGAPDEGTFGVGALLSALGALLLLAAGALGLRPARPATLPPRYDLDADDADDEWRLASGDPDDGGGPDRTGG